MLNTIRAVALELLGERRDSAADPLVDLWVRRAGRVDVLHQPGRAQLAQVEEDLPTTRLVLAALARHGRYEDAATILFANRRTLAALGRQDETLRAATALLGTASAQPGTDTLRTALPGTGPPRTGLSDATRARVSVVAGGAAYVCGSPDAERLLAALPGLAPDDATYRVLGHTSSCVLMADRLAHDRALEHARSAIAVADAAGSTALQRLSHSAAAWAAIRRDDPDAAATHSRRQLEFVTDDSEAVLSLVDVVTAELCRGDIDAAEEVAREGLLAARRLGPSYLLAEAQRALGYVLLRRGAGAEAAAVLAASIAGWAAVSDELRSLEVVAAIGLAAELAGPPGAGAPLVRRATAFAHRAGTTESAVAKELLPLARLVPDLDGSRRAAVPPYGSPAELVAEALALAATLAAQPVDATRP
jgi:hypothetical protein